MGIEHRTAKKLSGRRIGGGGGNGGGVRQPITHPPRPTQGGGKSARAPREREPTRVDARAVANNHRASPPRSLFETARFWRRWTAGGRAGGRADRDECRFCDPGAAVIVNILFAIRPLSLSLEAFSTERRAWSNTRRRQIAYSYSGYNTTRVKSARSFGVSSTSFPLRVLEANA